MAKSMKAELIDNNLVIFADNDTEAYALTQWKESKSQAIVNTDWHKQLKQMLLDMERIRLEAYTNDPAI